MLEFTLRLQMDPRMDLSSTSYSSKSIIDRIYHEVILKLSKLPWIHTKIQQCTFVTRVSHECRKGLTRSLRSKETIRTIYTIARGLERRDEDNVKRSRIERYACKMFGLIAWTTRTIRNEIGTDKMRI